MSVPHNFDMGPWGQFPGIVLRTSDRISIQIPHSPDASGYRVWASSSVDSLYGAPIGSGVVAPAVRQNLFTVLAGRMFRSPTIRRNGWGACDEKLGKATRAIFTLQDFPALNLSNNAQVYLAVQQIRAAGPAQALAGANAGFDITGPILALPPPEVLSLREGTVVITGGVTDLGVSEGDAPSGFDQTLDNGGAGNGPPTGVVLPWPTTSVTVRNKDAANGLAVSFGWNQPYLALGALGGGDFEITTFGSVKEIYLSSVTPGSNPTFVIIANLDQGASGGV